MDKELVEFTDIILCSDIHLRETHPICRTDDFVGETQWNKLSYLHNLQQELDALVFHGGDLFNKWKSSPWLLRQAMIFLPEAFYTVCGQHDLQDNTMDNYKTSSIAALEVAENVNVIEGLHYGQQYDKEYFYFKYRSGYRSILILHKFVWDGDNIPWPGCNELTADEVLDMFPDADLILTGDNHTPFVHERDGRLLVNPGSFTRQAADYKFHKPRVYLWNAETNTVKPHYIPINKEAVTREHIEIEEERQERLEEFNERVESYISKLNDDWDVTASFEENLKRFNSNNKVEKPVMDIIIKSIKK